MRKYELKGKDIKLHNILFATTSTEDYEMSRLILLERMPDTDYDEYVLIEGWHCSCYEFDDTEWEAIIFSREELNKLTQAEPYSNERKQLNDFWKAYTDEN